MSTMTNKKRLANQGFTLMELLVVIGIIAILAALVVVAINPARQFAQSQNAQRESNVSTILNAIGQNIADNKGTFTCPDIGTQITAAASNIGTGNSDLDSCLVPTYIPSAIPFDPDGGAPANTRYTVAVDSLGRFTVCAPNHAEPALADSTTYCLTR